MSFRTFENYVFIPEGEKGTLYELLPSDSLDKDSFIMLPYSDPQVKKTQPRFFKIKSRVSLDSLPPADPVMSKSPIRLKAKTSREDYIEKILRLKEHIQRGNIYEINYCIQFVAEDASPDPVSVFIKLYKTARAPYSVLLKMGNEYILCASPELFLKKQGKFLSSKPIKGTTRRGKSPEEDLQLKNELQNSLKERTENVMAVDVARNDLSKFAEKGSVHVNKLYNIETFETVHQMVSTVSCNIKENTSFETIIDATFPMASMTGAPKLRAMELIGAVEDFERNYYSGAMGFVNENGDYTLSVIIRSIFYNAGSNMITIAVGGAITYLSDPEKEYEECLLKAGALLKALEAEII